MQLESPTLECLEWPVGAWRRREREAPRRAWWPALAAGFLVGLLTAAGLGATWVGSAWRGQELRASSSAAPAAVLTREWRWERQPIRFDAMLRQAR